MLDWVDVNMGIEIHRYFRLATEGSAWTKVLHGVTVESASYPPGGEATERADMAATLGRLKQLVERGPKRWWQFWK